MDGNEGGRQRRRPEEWKPEQDECDSVAGAIFAPATTTTYIVQYARRRRRRRRRRSSATGNICHFAEMATAALSYYGCVATAARVGQVDVSNAYHVLTRARSSRPPVAGISIRTTDSLLIGAKIDTLRYVTSFDRHDAIKYRARELSAAVCSRSPPQSPFFSVKTYTYGVSGISQWREYAEAVPGICNRRAEPEIWDDGSPPVRSTGPSRRSVWGTKSPRICEQVLTFSCRHFKINEETVDISCVAIRCSRDSVQNRSLETGFRVQLYVKPTTKKLYIFG